MVGVLNCTKSSLDVDKMYFTLRTS